jgi:hypothetical protein
MLSRELTNWAMNPRRCAYWIVNSCFGEATAASTRGTTYAFIAVPGFREAALPAIGKEIL